MKKYFTKYLPTGGEKVGCKRSECVGMCSAKEPLEFNCDNSVPPKLFLCSRDIQVGDTFFHVNQYGNCSPENVCTSIDVNGVVESSSMWAPLMTEEHKKQFPKSDLYKVIGEVSLAAVWVTERMEFDRNDFGSVLCQSGEVSPIKFNCPTCKSLH